MKVFIKICLLFIVISQSSCAVRDFATISKRKTLEITKDSRVPDIEFVTPMSKMGSVIGGAVGMTMYFKGMQDDLVNKKIENPDNRLKRYVSSIFKEKYGLQILAQKDKKIYGPRKNKETVKNILSQYSDADLVLDVFSEIQGDYTPLDFSKYKLTYTAWIRVIDKTTKAVVFDDVCIYSEGLYSVTPGHTRTDLTQNTKVLSPILEEAYKDCAKSIRSAFDK